MDIPDYDYLMRCPTGRGSVSVRCIAVDLDFARKLIDALHRHGWHGAGILFYYHEGPHCGIGHAVVTALWGKKNMEHAAQLYIADPDNMFTAGVMEMIVNSFTKKRDATIGVPQMMKEMNDLIAHMTEQNVRDGYEFHMSEASFSALLEHYCPHMKQTRFPINTNAQIMGVPLAVGRDVANGSVRLIHAVK